MNPGERSRMSAPRLTLRSSLILLAVIAAALGTARLLHRRSVLLAKSERYRAYEAWYELSAGVVDRPETARDARETAAFYGRLRAKYERAAARPWLSIGPDTPPPIDRAAIEAEMEPGWNETQRAIYRAIRQNGWQGDIRTSDVARILDRPPDAVARELEPMFGTLLWDRAEPDPILHVR